MKIVDINEATEALSEYARRAATEPVVVTSNGKPCAAVIPLDNADLETASLRGCFRTRSAGPRPSEAVRGEESRRGDTTESIVEEARRSIRAAVAGRSQDGVLGF
jgi:prevent-host-death family protein